MPLITLKIYRRSQLTRKFDYICYHLQLTIRTLKDMKGILTLLLHLLAMFTSLDFQIFGTYLLIKKKNIFGTYLSLIIDAF